MSAEQISPELVERMVAHFHKVAAMPGVEGWGDQMSRDALAIARELPKPVDPDLLAARQMALTTAISCHGQWDNPNRRAAYEGGEHDADPRSGVQLALAAIKRGRALALAESSK